VAGPLRLMDNGVVFASLTDNYSRTARLMPALLVALPISVTALAAIPVAVAWWQRIGSLLVASGVPVLATQIVRDRGRRAQEKLFAEWGGPPTTALLRWSGPEPKAAVQRRHELLAPLLGHDLPDEADEARDPTAADGVYAMATTSLRERTRSDEFSLLLTENISYGFRRNLFGCRVIGVLAALFSAAAAALFGWTHILLAIPMPSAIALIIFDALCLLTWWRVVTPTWVRNAADIYARRLFDSLEIVSTGKSQ
jgi:hypothetical protein